MKMLPRMVCLLCISVAASGCVFDEHVGTYPGGTSNFPPNPVTVEQAVQKATPYLAKTYALRSKGRAERPQRTTSQPVITVTLKGDDYHIVQDDYPSYTPGFYLPHAVRVNKNTGVVVAPE